MITRFRDRRDAGQWLAADLHAYAGRTDVIVLALPRGGVPVAYEVAATLGAPLDVFVVRKLGLPGHEELAMGPPYSSTTGSPPDRRCELQSPPFASRPRHALWSLFQLRRRKPATRSEHSPMTSFAP
jgi:hypothetical protein